MLRFQFSVCAYGLVHNQTISPSQNTTDNQLSGLKLLLIGLSIFNGLLQK